jgi:murein L,D-transpeptidase YcbB/YkuD
MVLFVAVVVAMSFLGCGKKQPAIEEGQDVLSLSGVYQETGATVPQAAAGGLAEAVAPAGQPASLTEAKAEPLLPPSGPFKPSTIEIQTALKNAGFYLDEVDGKLGPRTRKAIEDFQSGHNLKADGKVGPQTWSVLQGYLNPPAAQETKKAKKR